MQTANTLIRHGGSVHPAKTGIRPDLSVFMVHSMSSLGFNLSSCGHRRLWSDWADAQADLSLRWAHRSFCWFSHKVAHLKSVPLTSLSSSHYDCSPSVAAAHWTVTTTLTRDYFQHRIMCKTTDTQYFVMNEPTCTLSMIIFVILNILVCTV